MSDIYSGTDPQSILRELNARRGAASQALAKGYGSDPGKPADALTQIAAKRNSDSIKFSYFLLKQRLTTELDQTLSNSLNKNPQLKNKVFIGILTDADYRAEVVNIDDAANAVTDMPADQAREVLRKNPVGYFKSADFTMKTPSDDAYQELQKDLDTYFRRNQDVFDYLRTHPEADVDASDFYTPV